MAFKTTAGNQPTEERIYGSKTETTGTNQLPNIINEKSEENLRNINPQAVNNSELLNQDDNGISDLPDIF